MWRRRIVFFFISKTIKNKTRQCSHAQGSTNVEKEGVLFCVFFIYIFKAIKNQNKTMLPGTRQHKCGVGGGVHTKISRPTASLKEGQYFTSHCLPPPILPCHTACFFPICMAMGFCTCSKRSVTKPNENLLHSPGRS